LHHTYTINHYIKNLKYKTMKLKKLNLILALVLCLCAFLHTQAQLKVYTMNGCGRCAFSIKYLKEKGIPFKEYNTSNNDANDNAMWALLKGKTNESVKMPVIDNNGEVAFNISDLEGYFKKLATKNQAKPNNNQPSKNDSNKDVVTIFQHANYQGLSQILKAGKYDLKDISIGNDEVSSIKVPEGMYVLLFEDANFSGDFIEVHEDESFIDDFNDLTSSIEIGYYEEEESKEKDDPKNRPNNNTKPSFKGCATGSENVPAQNEVFEKRVFELANQERRKAGKPDFLWSDNFARAARYHAADMAVDNYFDHNTYDFDKATSTVVRACNTFERIKAFGSGVGFAENIAKGGTTPEATMQQWMNSPGHKRNILGDFTTLGVGYFNGLWVQVFGKK
jgi:uncharacterized protein YkwD/glutaredoxin